MEVLKIRQQREREVLKIQQDREEVLKIQQDREEVFKIRQDRERQHTLEISKASLREDVWGEEGCRVLGGGGGGNMMMMMMMQRSQL